MQYSTAYHLHCEITLQCGRDIILEDLWQQQTYAGLIEGIPFPKINDGNIQRAIDTAKKLCEINAKPYLIEPVRRDYLREPGDMKDVYAIGNRKPEWLPGVRCIGSFKSFPSVRNDEMYGSCLVIVWYQDDFGLLKDSNILSQISAINWNTVAANFDY